MKFHDFPGPDPKFHDFPGLESKLSNSMTFQVFQDRYEPCIIGHTTTRRELVSLSFGKGNLSFSKFLQPTIQYRSMDMLTLRHAPTAQHVLTSTEDLREDTALVGRIDLVRGFTLLVGAIQQTAIFGVTKQLLSNTLALGAQADVQDCVTSLEQTYRLCHLSRTNIQLCRTVSPL